MDLLQIPGEYYKTITIPTSAGCYKYNINVGLSDAGLPPSAEVLGVFIRMYDDGAGGIAYSATTGKRLANKSVFPYAFITIQDTSTNTIISQYNLEYLQTNPFFFERKGKDEIDWNNSYIEISNLVNSANIVDNEVFEFVIIYTVKCEIHQIAQDWMFRTGEIFEKARFKLLTIPTQVNVQEYQLAPATNVGIPGKYWLIGIDLNCEPVNYGRLTAAQRSSIYFSLQQGALKFMDTISMYLNFTGKPRPQFQRNFLPIIPTRIKDIDFQGSIVKFMDPAAPQNGQAITFGLIYVKE